MDSAVSSSPFLRSVVEAIRVRHYSIRTEKAYIDWIKRFILFHDKRHTLLKWEVWRLVQKEVGALF